jgi:outer membrane protein OmpA-like peptidoglycan-associated protein
LQQVQFDTSKATIKKISDKLLDEVTGVLKEHPEITKIEVQGHTDDRGGADLNDKLSEARANAVREWLIKRGIEADRLTAKGYGQNVPIGDNKTEKGRQENRRVQFVIKEKKPKAAKP